MYIEFVLADNFLLTLLSGVMAARLCHKRARMWRTVAAAALGSGVAATYPLMRIGAWGSTGIKIALWATLSFIMFFKTPRVLPSAIALLLSTFALGGGCYAVWLCLGAASPVAKYCASCPLFLTLSCGVVVYAFFCFIARKIRLPRVREPYEMTVEVKIFDNTLVFDAFLDTGNCVFDDVTGLPIAVTDIALFTSKLDCAASAEFVKNADSFRKTNVRTATGNGKLIVIKPQSMTAVYSDKRKHTINAMVGLTVGGGFCKQHEMLIGPSASEAV